MIHIKAVNEKSLAAMTALKEKNTIHINISRYFNTDSICANSEWRSGKYVVFNSNYFSFVESNTQKVFRDFDVSTVDFKMAMINYGMSEKYTRATKKSKYSGELTIPVNRKGQILSLLFVNEIEIRLTGSRVGELVLNYKDGDTTQVPLICGKNIDALSKFFAPDLIPIRMKNTDYAKIYSLPINPDKVLESFTIKLDAADIQIGLMGVNLISLNN